MNSVQDTAISGGLPHSEIQGSTIARISPWLIAACYVLHRLSVPRHPPDALVLTLDRKIRRLQGQARQSERFHVKTLIRKTGNRNRAAFSLPLTPSSRCQRTLPAMMPANPCLTRSYDLIPSVGGGERNRTVDLLLAKQALSQLSYTPSAHDAGGPGRI
jgi:hypothetical protein